MVYISLILDYYRNSLFAEIFSVVGAGKVAGFEIDGGSSDFDHVFSNESFGADQSAESFECGQRVRQGLHAGNQSIDF